MDPSKQIVITGAAGMIGSAIVRLLNDQGFTNLLLVDNLKRGEKWKNLVGKSFVDFIGKEALFDRLKSDANAIQAMVHLGACSDTTESDGDYLLENNYRYSIRLAEFAFEHNCRFIYASSAATYGDGSFGFSDDEDALEMLSPLNMYGYSKHLVDLWMRRNHLLSKAVGLKYFNVFGPNEYHKGKMASMVYKMSKIAREGEEITLFKSNDPKRYKDGEQLRDFIYIKDAARITLSFLEPKLWGVGGIFNVGRGEPVSWNSLALSLFDALNREKRIRYVPMPGELSKQYQNYTCAEMGKFHALHREKPFSLTPISDAVKDYIQNYVLSDQRW